MLVSSFHAVPRSQPTRSLSCCVVIQARCTMNFSCHSISFSRSRNTGGPRKLVRFARLYTVLEYVDVAHA